MIDFPKLCSRQTISTGEDCSSAADVISPISPRNYHPKLLALVSVSILHRYSTRGRVIMFAHAWVVSRGYEKGREGILSIAKVERTSRRCVRSLAVRKSLAISEMLKRLNEQWGSPLGAKKLSVSRWAGWGEAVMIRKQICLRSSRWYCSRNSGSIWSASSVVRICCICLQN